MTPNFWACLSVEDFLPVFGRVSDVVVSDVDNYYIVCDVFTTECFCNHYHAYEISSSSPVFYSFVKQSQLTDHLVLAVYKSKFIVLKYNVL